MRADSISLLEFIGASKRTFCIPVYQRNYDWKQAQCITLFQDIERVIQSKKENSHFLGTIVYIEENSSANFREFTVIDGQQRLTSVMLLLKAIAEETTIQNLKQEIIEEYLLNRFSPEPLRIKLKPMKSDAKVYYRLIYDRAEELEKSPIYVNYQLFCQLIRDSHFTPEEIFNGVQKLEVVYIQLEKENPQLIFESLNSTGLDLTQADLIRNYLLMGQPIEKQEELYLLYWCEIEKLLPDTMISDFIRDYLILKTALIPKKDKVYQSFKEYYSICNYETETLLKELYQYAQYYSWFKYCNSKEELFNTGLTQLQHLKSTVVYPFLLDVFERYFTKREIEKVEVITVINIIVCYVIRRLLCDFPTSSISRVFASMKKEILQYKGSLSERVAKVLLDKKGKASFPNNFLLKEKLLTRDCYNFAHLKYILEWIEQSQGKENVDFSQLSIEHIMPQTLTPKWRIDLGKHAAKIHETYLHRLGNLTLTGYNSEMSNHSFEEKKEIYKESNLKINRDIAKYDNWTEKEIIMRGEELFEKIIEIWEYPEWLKEEEKTLKMRTDFDIVDEVDVTGRTPCELTICGTTFHVDSWKTFFKCICKQLYEYDSQLFRSLTRHKDFQGRKKRIISDRESDLRNFEKIAEGVYIELTLSANDTLNYTKLIVDKFEGMENEISYHLRGN